MCLGAGRAPDATGKCVPHVKCAAGTFTKIPGSSRSQPTCEPCPPGYYKTLISATGTQTDECVAHSTCSAGEYTAIAGNTTDDSQCLSVVIEALSSPGVPTLGIAVPASVVVLVVVIGVAAFIWCVKSIHY